MAHARLRDRILAAAAAQGPAPSAEQVVQKQDGDVLEARSTSKRIKTVDDLLRHIEADMTRYEVAASEATKWENANSEGQITELHRVFVRLKPKAGAGVKECVETMIAAASKSIRRTRASAHKKRDGLWQVLVIADCHYGKYAWSKTTGPAGGGDYDLDIADKLVRESAAELIEVGDRHKPSIRTIALVGDIMHYDNPRGQTTALTQVERDGRLQKMIDMATAGIIGAIERSAETTQTNVVMVNGNHDETLTYALQRTLFERFRGDRRVSVSMDYAGRQYAHVGRTLLGFAHGHKAKRKLGQIMALEQPEAWAKSRCREWHTGHFHSQAAEWQMPIETVNGVVIRQAPSLSAADDWHSEHGFIGSRQAMETFLYRPEGGLVSMHVAGPA